MGIIPPRWRRRVDPSVGEQIQADLTRAAAEDAAASQRAHMPRAAAVAAGPELRDLAAAVDCCCACHPRPADMDLHDGGVTCRCQLTREELRQRFDEFEATAAKHREQIRPHLEAEQAEFATLAGELGVEAVIECRAAPFAITGRCDGHSFFLRARHDLYRVALATDPSVENLWHDAYTDGLEVASGADFDLYGDGDGVSPTVALRVAVDAVRTSIRRARCDHEQPTDDSHLYCRNCGVDLAAADAWRWPDPVEAPR